MESNLIFTSRFRIRTREIDGQKRITLPALIGLLQETSMQHILKIGASFWDMGGKSWVLLSKQINVDYLPSLGEEIKVVTYPSGFDRIFAFRDYKVYNSQDRLIAWAPSTWVLIDLESKRPCKIPKDLLYFNAEKQKEVLPRIPRKTKLNAEMIKGGSHRMGYFDLDWNGHVNNAHFFRILLEDNADRYKMNIPSKISLYFKQEAMEGDQLTVYNSEIMDGKTEHIIARDDEEIAIAHLTWINK